MKKKGKNRFLLGVEPFLVKKYGLERAGNMMENAWSRYIQLCLENTVEPKAMAMHTKHMIYPGIAVFDALILAGEGRETAAGLIKEYYGLRSQGMAKMLKKLLKIPGLYRRMPKIFEYLTKKMFGESAGFHAEFYDTGKQELRFDMIRCPYFDICKRYGCPEIVKAYCDADEICYDGMHPKILWGRTKTLGGGDNCCDFKITVVNKNAH